MIGRRDGALTGGCQVLKKETRCQDFWITGNGGHVWAKEGGGRVLERGFWRWRTTENRDPPGLEEVQRAPVQRRDLCKGRIHQRGQARKEGVVLGEEGVQEERGRHEPFAGMGWGKGQGVEALGVTLSVEVGRRRALAGSVNQGCVVQLGDGSRPAVLDAQNDTKGLDRMRAPDLPAGVWPVWRPPHDPDEDCLVELERLLQVLDLCLGVTLVLPLGQRLEVQLDAVQQGLGARLQLLQEKPLAEIWVVPGKLLAEPQTPIPDPITGLGSIPVLEKEMLVTDLKLSALEVEEDRRKLRRTSLDYSH